MTEEAGRQGAFSWNTRCINWAQVNFGPSAGWCGSAPPAWRSDFYHEHRFVHTRIPRSEGVRTERFTYLRWLDRDPVVEELYDHRADFDQVYDLSVDPAYGATLAQLRRRTDALGARYLEAATKED